MPGTVVTDPPTADASEDTDTYDSGYEGDVDEQAFYAWAAYRRVGSLDLSTLEPGGSLNDLAKGYCDRLSDQPDGSGAAVTRLIGRETGGTQRQSRELLEHVVMAFCPQKARHLV